MYYSHILQPVHSNRIFAAGIKFYELVKLAFKPSIYKENNSKEYLPYILNALVKGYTVLDIGSHKRAYILDLSKVSKLPGKLVAFETSPAIYAYLKKMKHLMNLENVAIEQLDNSKKDIAAATVIDFKARMKKEENESTTDTTDNYCSRNFIIPALIKFKLERNELKALQGAKEILQKYKPQILLECSEGTVSRETLLTAFTFLSGLHYSGYFILDTLKVPLANFDFDTYQNEVLGFYCNNFFFE